MTRRATAAAMLLCAVLPATATAEFPGRLLDPIFADHGVLQRDRPIQLWGEATPGAQVDLSLGGTHARALAGADGRWRATLPAVKAGGPYALDASAGPSHLAVADLLIGDVFLCSGQSNMEWPVGASVDGKSEVAHSADDRIRLLTVPQLSSATPVAHLAQPADWKLAGPASTGDFSAVCFFMAQDLRHAHPEVPIGLIDNSWGGSAISAWLRPDAYVAAGGDVRTAALVTRYASDPAGAKQAWAEIWQGWWAGHNPVEAEVAPWSRNYRPDAHWKPVPVLDRWSAWQDPALKDFVGLLWYRTAVTLNAEQAAQPATLVMSGVDDLDESWVNGRFVGTAWNGAPRHYPIPPGTLAAGENIVVVNDYNSWGDGGIFGPPDQRAIEFADGSRVPLSNAWSYRPVPEIRDAPPRAPWDAIAGVGTIQNGMVAPLGRYGIKAAAWYQGESDAGIGAAYEARLRALIGQWRQDFGRDLPVAVIQLPNFGPSTSPPVHSDWAALRDAQRRTVDGDIHAALVVTIDLGEPGNLHPPNKRPVGARLAAAVEHIAYGGGGASGPAPLSARRHGDQVTVGFDMSDGALRPRVASPVELCGAADASCRLVPAAIAGDRLILRDDPAATRVRYCWADSPTCTLAGRTLPVTPFELAIQ